jgi:hypothetical protein
MEQWDRVLQRVADADDQRFVLPETVGGFIVHLWVRGHTRDRLVQYLRRPFGEPTPFRFTQRDRLYLTLTSNSGIRVDLNEWTRLFLNWLDDRQIPARTPALVRINLLNRRGTRVGGAAFYQQRLGAIEDLEIGRFLQRLNENGYLGVELADCELEFSFPVDYLIQSFIRGGCIQHRQFGRTQMHLVEDQKRRMIIPNDLWLYRYNVWTTGQKARLTSINMDTVPAYLGNLRGIFYIGWDSRWTRPVCGFMAVAYMVEVFRYRLALSEHRQAFFDTSNLDIWESDLHLLYLHACRLADRFPGTLRETNGDMLTLHDLGALVHWLEPRCTLVVYDDSRRRLFTKSRTSFTVGNTRVRDPAPPFRIGDLTPTVYEEYAFTRIVIFYDHTYRHFLPVFDTNRFFSMPHQRKWLPSSVQPNGLSPSTVDIEEHPPQPQPTTAMHYPNEGNPSSLSSRPPKYEYYIPCPCCDVIIIKSKVREHVCRNALTCLSCGVSFATQAQFHEHQGEGYPVPCPLCHVSLYPGCERAHRNVCNNRQKLPRCPRCRGIYATEPHYCLAYHCYRCGQRKRDQKVFDACSGKWRTGLHQCYLSSSRQYGYAARLNAAEMGDDVAFESQQERLLYQLAQYRYFVFDFESMLDGRDGLVFPFARQLPTTPILQAADNGGIHLSPVFIHRVNCVSFCEMDLFSSMVNEYWKNDSGLHLLIGKIRTFLEQMEVRVVDFESFKENPVRMFMEQENIPTTSVLLRRVRVLFALIIRPTIDMQTVLTLDAFWAKVIECSTAVNNVWYAHNLKGYDGRLLYDHLKDCGIVPKEVLWRGGKLFRLQYLLPNNRSVVFLDSMNHISTSLRKMPSMFGLDTSVVRKGLFPYRFNHFNHQDYRGVLPDKIWFDVQWMRESEYKEFEIWYNEQLELVNRVTVSTEDDVCSEDPVFRQAMIDRYWWSAPDPCPITNEPRSFKTTGIYDLQTEMRLYCENDVYVLKLSLERYHLLCTSTTHCSPEASITVAQFTYLTYVNLYMPPDCIQYLDDNEYDFARRALRGGNTNVRQLYWEADPTVPGHGLRYIDVQSLYPSVQFYDPLPIGRPKIYYYLKYPETQTGEEPLREQPDAAFLMSFFGFIECDITPLVPLFHPVILCSTGVYNKVDYLSSLTAASYRRAANVPFVDESSNSGATASVTDVPCGSGGGKLIGPMSTMRRVVITSVELQEGLRRRLYRVDRVYRIDEYRSSTDLFKRFIRTWLRIKITNSKCPVDVNDPVAFREFSRQCQQRYGFRTPLTPEDFSGGLNVGLRNFAKLQLNSLWGKFGQRNTLDSHFILRTGEEHARYATMCRIGNFVESSSSWVEFGRPPCQTNMDSTSSGSLSGVDADEPDGCQSFGYLPVKICVAKKVNEQRSKNVAIASFVTAHARMRLWRKCFEMGERVVYHDTDSMIYEVRDDWSRVEEGHFLGDWESETGDALIERFVSIAPKTYAYTYTKPNGQVEEVVKSKGFYVHREAELFFNFDGYVSLLVGSLLHHATAHSGLRDRLERTIHSFPGLRELLVAFGDFESRRTECCAVLGDVVKRWNRSHLTDLLKERFSVVGPDIATLPNGGGADDDDEFIFQSKRCRVEEMVLRNERSANDATVLLNEDGTSVLNTSMRRWLIWKDMCLPSRQLSIVHDKSHGVTLSYQCLKSMSFYYGKGLICVDSLKTFPFGIVEQFRELYHPSSFIGFVGATMVWPMRYSIKSIDFSFAVDGPQYNPNQLSVFDDALASAGDEDTMNEPHFV